jgi:hypothetical protein
MSVAIHVETFKVPPKTRALARKGEVSREWRSAYVVRFYNEKTAECALGGGSSRRVASMRAAEAAEAKGWF